MTTDEFARKRRVLDQTLTGHALLRDRYGRRATILSLFILSMSILATATAFLKDSQYLSILGLTLPRQDWIGIVTTAIFLLTIVDLRLDWGKRSGVHADAAQRLARLKGLFRIAESEPSSNQVAGTNLDREYDSTMEQLPPIPEQFFLYAKALHLHKVCVSRLLDRHAGAPLWYVNVLATIAGMRASANRTHAERDEIRCANKDEE